VLDAFALVIIAAGGPPVFDGLSGPNVAMAKDHREHVYAAMDALRPAAPDSGAYVNECDYFQSDWQQRLWGSNYPRLLEAYRALRARIDAPPLVIAGRPGWAYGDTLEKIRAEPGVRYLGHVDEPTLSALYESAGVLAFPSLYEGFGLPLLEAMAHGLPAVVGQTGALPELGGDVAVLVDPQDVDAIAGGLEELLTDQPLRERLRGASMERAKKFTWERSADLTRKALRDIARVRS